MGSKKDIEKININTQEHPAYLAWKELNPNASPPQEIIVLKDKKKSKVFQLKFTNESENSVIAKAGRIKSLYIEKKVYEEILPDLSIDSADYLGFVKRESNKEFSWLFLEFVKGILFDRTQEEHLLAAIKWLGGLHSSHLPEKHIALLSDRSVESYYNYLKRGLNNLILYKTNQNLSREHIDTLSNIQSKLQVIKLSWEQIDNFCQPFPNTFIHGDYQAKNNVIQTINSHFKFVCIDWEMAGWGTPAIDLGRFHRFPDAMLSAYWELTKKNNRNMSFQNLISLSQAGEILRLIIAIYWASRGLKYDWVHRSMKNLTEYRKRLAKSIHDFEWIQN